jgi:hypothetical protein
MSAEMMALVYRGPGDKAWEKVPKPVEIADTDRARRRHHHLWHRPPHPEG